MFAITIIVTVFLVFLCAGTFLVLRQPRETSQRERQRRVAVERLCATLLAADENPMYVIPPQATELAHQLTTSKELNP